MGHNMFIVLSWSIDEVLTALIVSVCLTALTRTLKQWQCRGRFLEEKNLSSRIINLSRLIYDG